MDKERLRDIIYIIVAIIFSVIAIKIFIWLLPVIIVAILAYFIYKSMKKSLHQDKWEKQSHEKTQKKKKKIIIIDEEK